MKPRVSIIIPTLVRETLYPLVDALVEQRCKFPFEIVLVPQASLDMKRLQDSRVKIFPQPAGKGFAYYRNYGIKKSRGDVLAFIDDDELPMNTNWLSLITAPLFDQKFDVATAGVKIKLGKGYLTDSISLLGFPGGGAVGFKTMWHVDSNNITNHLCSGNLAIRKLTLLRVGGFAKSRKYGNEDVHLADALAENHISIQYVDRATVYHVERSGLINFVRWNLLRGKSAAIYLKSKKSDGKVSNRLRSTLGVLSLTWRKHAKYIPGVIFCMINQYLWQTLAFVREKAK